MSDIKMPMKFRVDLEKPLVTQQMSTALQQGDVNANVIQADVRKSNKAADLSAYEAEGYMLRGDGERVLLPGTIEGGLVQLTLDAYCYQASGACMVIVRLKNADGIKRTILRLAGYVESEGEGSILDPANTLPNWDSVVKQLETMMEKTDETSEAAQGANEAAQNANNAAQGADAAAQNANNAAQGADAAAQRASNAAQGVEDAQERAIAAAQEANDAATNASEAAEEAKGAAEIANNAAEGARAAAELAEEAAENSGTYYKPVMNESVLEEWVPTRNKEMQGIYVGIDLKGDDGIPGKDGIPGGYYTPVMNGSILEGWEPSAEGMPVIASGIDLRGPSGNSPYIGENGNWYTWDDETGAFVDTGVAAGGQNNGDGGIGEDSTDQPEGGGNGSDETIFPVTNVPHQMLVTNADGETVWEDRTHYKGNMTVLPETSLAYDAEEGTFSTSEAVTIPAIGTVCTIKWNGTEYSAELKEYNMGGQSAPVLGNLSVFGGADTGEPFMIMLVPPEMLELTGGITVNAAALDGATELVLSIEHVGYHKLPMEYLPDGLPYVQNEDVVVLPEETFSPNEEGSDLFAVSSAPNLEDGLTYRVTWNGVEYETKAGLVPSGILENAVALGDLSGLGGSVIDPDVPFGLAVSPALMQYVGTKGIFIANDGSTTITASIVLPAGTVYKMDEKFLPDTAAKISDIPDIPVKSVNGKTGAVSLTAADVGALPNTTKIPDGGPFDMSSDDGINYTVTVPGVTAYSEGTTITVRCMKTSAENTGVWLNVNGLGDRQLKWYNHQTASSLAPVDGWLQAGCVFKLLFWSDMWIVSELYLASFVATNLLNSVANGLRTNLSASEDDSYKVGYGAFAQGPYSKASGTASHAEGFGTIATGNWSHVEGQYNTEDTEQKYAHIVGNGENGLNRSNAHTLDWDGNAWFAGDIYVGGTSQDDAPKMAVTAAPVSASDNGKVLRVVGGAWAAADDGTGALREQLDSVMEAIADKVQLTPKYANNISECVDTDSVYVLPDGYIYAYMMSLTGAPAITIEEGAGGYWYSDEWNPLGKFTANTATSAKKTNIIPVTPGDQLNYKGYGADAVDSVTWLDSNKNFLSNAQIDSTAAYTMVTAPENAAYVWFSSFSYTTSVSNVVLDVVWVLCQAAGSSETGVWTNTGHAFVPADYEDRIIALEKGSGSALSGSHIVYDGDSICMGYNADGGYPAQIAAITGGTATNAAIGGATLCANASGHSVSANVSNLPTDGDLYCFQGGINDYWSSAQIGTCTKGDYTGALDTSTICGALETIFRYALTNFVGKPVCFVITHKVQSTAYQTNSAGHTFEDYRNAMIEVCEKYSIPYYDAFARSGLNGWNTAQSNNYLTGNSAGTADGIHPNAEGYSRYYTPQLLAMFREIMPGR